MFMKNRKERNTLVLLFHLRWDGLASALSKRDCPQTVLISVDKNIQKFNFYSEEPLHWVLLAGRVLLGILSRSRC